MLCMRAQVCAAFWGRPDRCDIPFRRSRTAAPRLPAIPQRMRDSTQNASARRQPPARARGQTGRAESAQRRARRGVKQRQRLARRNATGRVHRRKHRAPTRRARAWTPVMSAPKGRQWPGGRETRSQRTRPTLRPRSVSRRGNPARPARNCVHVTCACLMRVHTLLVRAPPLRRRRRRHQRPSSPLREEDCVG